MLAAAPAADVEVLKAVNIVGYGPPPPWACGVLALGQVLTVKTPSGETLEIIVRCPELYQLPKPAQVCDLTVQTGPAKVLVSWPDQRNSSAADPTPRSLFVAADCSVKP